VYIPELFKIADASELVALMRARPFATLISAGPGGLNATHLPTVLKIDGEQPVSIECHVARANPHWKEFSSTGDALMIFGGSQGYIRPGWYPSKSVDGKAVPTWNYTVVHAYGRTTAIDDRVWLERHVRELTAQQEHDQPAPWTPDDAPRSRSPRRQVQDEQNRTTTDRAGVIRGLRARDAAGDIELAELVERADRGDFRSA